VKTFAEVVDADNLGGFVVRPVGYDGSSDASG
jgi:hypothetical protein